MLSVHFLYVTAWSGLLIFKGRQCVKVKAKFTLEQVTKAQRGEQKYGSTLSLTSAFDGVGG